MLPLSKRELPASDPSRGAAKLKAGPERPRTLGVVLSAVTGLQILASFSLQWYVLRHIHSGAQADAFYAAITVPQLVSVMLIDSLPLVLVPVLAALPHEELVADAWRILIAASVILAALASVLALAAPVLVYALVPGFTPANRFLTVALTRIQLWGLAGAGWTAILSSVYQVRHRFVWPPVAVLIATLAGWVLLLWQMESGGIRVAAWAQVIAAAGPAIVLLPILGWPRNITWQTGGLKKVWRMHRPLVLGKAYYLTSSPIDRLLTSFLPAGTLVTFELVSRFYAAVLRILTQGIQTPFLPHLSRLASAGHWSDFLSVYRRQSRTTLICSLMVVAATEAGVVVALPHVSGIPLSAAELVRLRDVILYLGIAFPFMTLANALSNAFYARGDSRSPAVLASIAYTVGLLARLVGFWLGGVSGLALASVAWTALHCALLYLRLQKDMKARIREELTVSVLPEPLGKEA